MNQAKSNIGLGILSVPTTYAFSRVGSAHPQTAPTANAVVSGMNLLNVGNVAKSGMLVAKGMTNNVSKKKTGNKYIDKII